MIFFIFHRQTLKNILELSSRSDDKATRSEEVMAVGCSDRQDPVDVDTPTEVREANKPLAASNSLPRDYMPEPPEFPQENPIFPPQQSPSVIITMVIFSLVNSI